MYRFIEVAGVALLEDTALLLFGFAVRFKSALGKDIKGGGFSPRSFYAFKTLLILV
jgi:hypothetical protein